MIIDVSQWEIEIKLWWKNFKPKANLNHIYIQY